MARSRQQGERKNAPKSTKTAQTTGKKKLSKIERELKKLGAHNDEGNVSPNPKASGDQKRASTKDTPVYVETDDIEVNEMEEEKEREFSTPAVANVASVARGTTQTGANNKNDNDETESESSEDADEEDDDVNWTEPIDDRLYLPIQPTVRNVVLTQEATYDTVNRCLNFTTATPAQQYQAAKAFYSDLQCHTQLLKGTRIFRYQYVPDVISGGASGSIWTGECKMLSCHDLDKLNRTRFAIQEKIFIGFRGFHMSNMKINGKIKFQVIRVSAVMRRLPSTSGTEMTQEEYERTVRDGYGEYKIRWADIRDVWSDYDYSRKLIKYFMAMGVRDSCWKHTYQQHWPKGTQNPVNELQWKAREEL